MNMRFRELFTGDLRRSGNTNVNVIRLVYITFAIGTSTSGSTTPTECSDPSQKPYGDFCYLARPEEEHTWQGAVNQCRLQDMELASVHSKSEGDFIHGLVTSQTRWEGVWIGMRRSDNGEFRWLDGTSTSIFNWAVGEPNSDKSGSTYDAECVEMYKSNGTWNDLACVRKLGYVCKLLKRTTVRLVGGSSLLEGRVEIKRNGAFGTVCDDYWDDNDAAVTCRMLGYSGGKAWKKSRYGRGSGSIWLDNVNCKGDEDDVFICGHRGWGIEDCDHTEDAGVSCYTMTQSTTTKFDQTEESTDTTIDVMGKSSSTASVQTFDTGMTCSQVRMDESGSKVIWNCRLTGVFPKAICQVEYFKHQISNNSAPPPLNHYSTNNASANKPDFVDSICTLEMPVELLDAGAYTFIMSVQPDVLEGGQHVQSMQSDFILVKHNVEASCTLYTNWIIGGAAAAIFIFLFICFFIGFCLGKRNGKGDNSTKADNHTGLDRGMNLEGLNMNTPSNSDEHPDQTTRYKPMTFNKAPTHRMSLKEKQQSKQQKPKKQQKSGNDIVDVNQSDPRSKTASQSHDYHHSKSNTGLNTTVFKQQQESNNALPKKAMLPRNCMEKQQQKNAAFDQSEEDLEPAETRNILSGTGRPSDGMTAAGWDEGPTGSDDENIYEYL